MTRRTLFASAPHQAGVFLLGVLMLLGCEEKAEPEQKKEAVEEAPAPPEETAAEKAAEAAAQAEAKAKQEEEAQAQAAVDENPLTECCRALGKKGFMERSPDYMAASKACGEAMEAKESPDKAMTAIKKALKGNSVPSECSP
jgi:hypothetical protein